KKKQSVMSHSEIKEYVKEWRHKLYLNEWLISVEFSGNPHPREFAATIDINTKYLRALITIYPTFFDADIEVQKHCIVHELCHIITDEMNDNAYSLLNGKLHNSNQLESANERATQRIADLLFFGPQSG